MNTRRYRIHRDDEHEVWVIDIYEGGRWIRGHWFETGAEAIAAYQTGVAA